MFSDNELSDNENKNTLGADKPFESVGQHIIAETNKTSKQWGVFGDNIKQSNRNEESNVFPPKIKFVSRKERMANKNKYNNHQEKIDEASINHNKASTPTDLSKTNDDLKEMNSEIENDKPEKNHKTQELSKDDERSIKTDKLNTLKSNAEEQFVTPPPQLEPAPESTNFKPLAGDDDGLFGPALPPPIDLNNKINNVFSKGRQVFF